MNAEKSVQHIRCKRQAQVFERYAKKGYDMPDFVKKYMNSEFCNLSMDDEIYSPYQVAMVSVIVDEIASEVTVNKYQDDRLFDPDVAYWVGYMYRLMQIKSGIASRTIYERFDLDDMCSVYEGYHTLSLTDALSRLLEQIEEVDYAENA